MKLTSAHILLTALPSALAYPSQPSAESDDDLYIEAGSHVIWSYPGLTPPERLLELTKAGRVGGIILFGENVDENIGDVVRQFQDAYASGPAYSGHPLLIMTDQEGGKVRRLPGGPEMTAKEIGESPQPILTAAKAGNEAADVLKTYNNNVNLGPVLDVWRTPENFLNKVGRSFSNDSLLVAGCSTAFLVAQQAAGVVATAKHFPGLGAAKDENTDLQQVTIDLPLEEIRAVDELPYISAIAAGVDMVMTSWAIYPSLDPERPAGMSKAWVQDELRKRLRFRGVTVTDALEAVSLEPFGNDAQRGFLAAQAGVDLLLASARNATQGEAVLEALVQGLKDGSLSKEEFREGTKRIERLRKKLRF
ncbi:hypothetical protein VTO42DRAFT_7890 [Malbranchea cinnamomea]